MKKRYLLSKLGLDDWLDYIARSHPSEIEMGLDRVRQVWMKLKSSLKSKALPQIVTVAGTNGKGSTVAMIEAGLNGIGFNVGSYTSPHIHRYNERVKLNGKSVSDELLVASFETVEKARGDVPLTYFEFGTLSALVILFSHNLDIICLEIGLGGRLDAVNIIDADVAVITSIALDHIDWLGNDIAQIGREKAGIFRANQTAFLGEDLPESIYEEASKLGVCVQTFGKEFELDRGAVDLRLPDNNIALAIQVVKRLSSEGGLAKAYKEINKLVLHGRLEKQKVKGKEVYLDVAHNPHAAVYLANFCDGLKAKGYDVVAVYSSLEDKDSVSVVAELSRNVSKWFLAPLQVPRALNIETLKDSVYEGLTKHSARKVGDAVESVLSFGNMPDAISEALSYESERPVVVLVFGSFFVVEAAHSYIQNIG